MRCLDVFSSSRNFSTLLHRVPSGSRASSTCITTSEELKVLVYVETKAELASGPILDHFVELIVDPLGLPFREYRLPSS